MKATLVFVPVGGGETEYQLDFELPSIPQQGDYISVFRPSSNQAERAAEVSDRSDFVVRRTWWLLDYPKAGSDEYAVGDAGSIQSLLVECEYATSDYSGENHKQRCLSKKITRNGPVVKMDSTMY